MLAQFDVKIVFNPSRDFSRCVMFSHIAAGALLLQSHPPLPLIGVGLLLLMASFFYSHHLPSPHPQYKSLDRQATGWTLEDQQGQKERYESVHIALDGGFFLLLRLTHSNVTKTLILFYDQITLDQRRRLAILSRIT